MREQSKEQKLRAKQSEEQGRQSPYEKSVPKKIGYTSDGEST
ncbi:hypothetical protein EC9_54270 [Rosistilla ulvae]|uniref:Uncharacterized protein n=1 Tax=Rosistilla ulvae TaxID=1930277 RepID=A0A517M8J7_9BACT|nr:hypothetical protein EC9_54270 [Rosistilla ulvae]